MDRIIDRPIGWTTLEEAKELRKLGLGMGKSMYNFGKL